jgi:tetratricopeptide (TPR) repeat protein
VTGPRQHRVASLVDLGRYTEAMELLQPLLAEHPDDPNLHGLRAQVMVGLDDWVGALAAGNQVVALLPDDEWGHRICAMALRNLDRDEEAVVAARTAVRLAPLAWQTHQQYALAAAGIPRLMQEARQAAARAVELGPLEPNTHFTYGVIAEALRQHDVARAAYERTLSLDPNHAPAQNQLTLMGSQLRLSRAAHGFASALRMDPGNTAAQANIDVLAFRFVRRVYWASLIALVVGLLAALTPSGDGKVTPTTIGIGCLLLVGVVAYTVTLARAIPVGVQRFVRRRLVTDKFLLATSVLTLGMLATGLAVCLVPGAALVGAAMLRPLGLLNVALFVWAMSRRQS